VLSVIVVLLILVGVGGYTIYNKYLFPILNQPGCSAGTGANKISLDFGQAADTATIAGVAARMKLPTQALTVAYATAYQESKWENLNYGDQDSHGIFQQQADVGVWGTVAETENPEFASTSFFTALVKVPNYTTLPVSVAAQDVQKSADGSAYQQWAAQGANLAADYTSAPHAVTCWFNPTAQAQAQGVSPALNLHGAATKLDEVFGTPGQASALTDVTRTASGSADEITTTSGAGWTVADWLVANASSYGITQVSYDGYRWSANLKETSWQPDASASASDIVAS